MANTVIPYYSCRIFELRVNIAAIHSDQYLVRADQFIAYIFIALFVQDWTWSACEDQNNLDSHLSRLPTANDTPRLSISLRPDLPTNTVIERIHNASLQSPEKIQTRVELADRILQERGVGISLDRVTLVREDLLQWDPNGQKISPAGYRQILTALAHLESDTESAHKIAEIVMNEPTLQGKPFNPATYKPVLVATLGPHVPGVFYAVSDSGLELPIIDITNPEFAPMIPQAHFPGLSPKAIAGLQQSHQIPKEIRRARAVSSYMLKPFHTAPLFYPSEPTYMAKLGPKFMVDAGDKGAASLTIAVATRYRLEALAAIEKSAIEAAASGETIHFFNIGGGPCFDTINALLLLNKSNPDFLKQHKIVITAYDFEPSGASFGRRSVAELQKPGGPLHNVHIDFRMKRFDWNKPDSLAQDLKSAGDAREKIIGVSEGGLFEYAPDEIVTQTLRIFADNTPADAPFLGSMFYGKDKVDGIVPVIMDENPRVGYQLRGFEALNSLVNPSGFQVDMKTENNPIFPTFRLERRPTGN